MYVITRITQQCRPCKLLKKYLVGVYQLVQQLTNLVRTAFEPPATLQHTSSDSNHMHTRCNWAFIRDWTNHVPNFELEPNSADV